MLTRAAECFAALNSTVSRKEESAIKKKLLGTALMLSSASLLLADNWPQFRGPDRTDISHETGLLKQWPASGPKQLWLNKDAGLGYSGFSIVGDTLYTQSLRG